VSPSHDDGQKPSLGPLSIIRSRQTDDHTGAKAQGLAVARPNLFVTCLYVVSAVLPEILGTCLHEGWEATWLV